MEIIPSERLEFSSSGNVIPGRPEDNLCLKAYYLLKRDFNLNPVKIHLHKIIPIGAGLGGGSSNAAYTLRLLNTIFGLKLTAKTLIHYASQIGSDCPFFIEDFPKMGKGRGEILNTVQINLKGKFVVLIIPPVHISTAEAYGGVEPTGSTTVNDIINQVNLSDWRNVLRNDFEVSIFKNYPEIQTIKKKLYLKNAVYASMSGSGSAVYGIFEREVDWPNSNDSTCWSGYLN